MRPSEPGGRIEALRREIARIAEAFAAAAEPAVVSSLERAVERLVLERAAWFNDLDQRTARALRAATGDAIRRSGATVAARLRDLELWLEPSVFKDQPGPVERLENPANRVWICLLGAAHPLDPVLVEFGLEPRDTPDWGGGHFGLQPQSLRELDPRGRLGRLWQRYLATWSRFHALVVEAVEEDRQRAEEKERDDARRRWRGSGA